MIYLNNVKSSEKKWNSHSIREMENVDSNGRWDAQRSQVQNVLCERTIATLLYNACWFNESVKISKWVRIKAYRSKLSTAGFICSFRFSWWIFSFVFRLLYSIERLKYHIVDWTMSNKNAYRPFCCRHWSFESIWFFFSNRQNNWHIFLMGTINRSDKNVIHKLTNSHAVSDEMYEKKWCVVQINDRDKVIIYPLFMYLKKNLPNHLNGKRWIIVDDSSKRFGCQAKAHHSNENSKRIYCCVKKVYKWNRLSERNIFWKRKHCMWMINDASCLELWQTCSEQRQN